jgi:hypothetical protein
MSSSGQPYSPAAASSTRLYFPVSSEPGPGGYEVLSQGASLAEFCLDVDSQRAMYLAQKHDIAQRPERGPMRLTHEPSLAAISGAESFVRERMLELPAFNGQASRLQGLTLDELLLELQEDLVIMHVPSSHAPERTRAVYMHVCFPGGWDPSQLLGKSFPALHARVPYEPGFDRTQRAGHAALLFQAPLARYVWSVTPEPTLDRHPKTPKHVTWSTADALYLRVERQVMVPLPATQASAGEHGSAALFFIRTYVYERQQLSLAQRTRLSDAIQALSEPMRRYKGMMGHEARILQLLHTDALDQ